MRTSKKPVMKRVIGMGARLMKVRFVLTLIAFSFGVAVGAAFGGLDMAVAAPTAGGTAAAPAPAVAVTKKKSTEVSFDDVLVQGKYHFSDEAVTTVEDDKILDALLGVRTDFKDRIKKSTARQ